jgi:hypothetical protein
MTNSVDELIDTLTRQMACQHNEPAAQLRPIVCALVAALQREYLARGAPDGPTTIGFTIWLAWQLRSVNAA